MNQITILRSFLPLIGLLATWSITSPEARAQENRSADSAIAVPTEWNTYYVVLVEDGPVGAEEFSSDSLRAIMDRHIQYQLRLQQTGQSVAGGGFGRVVDGVHGMTLLRADSLEEAQRLALADPAVIAGRFGVTVTEWYVPAGRLPE